MTIENMVSMIRAYMKQACAPLGLKFEAIELKTVFVAGLPLMLFFDSEQDHILVNKDFLRFVEQQRTPTLLRATVYKVVYEYYLFHKGATDTQETHLESFAFSLALCEILGLHVVNEHKLQTKFCEFNLSEFLPRMLRLLQDVFHTECRLRKVPLTDGKNLRTDEIVTMTDSAYQAYGQWMTRGENIHVSEVSHAELGSQENPFKNIEEACRFVQELELKTYSEDDFLHTRIEQAPFFYDGHQFKVEWANPYVAHRVNDYPSDAFIVNEVNRYGANGIWYSLRPNLYKRKFLYRGQSAFFSPCKPNLFRENKSNYIEDFIWGNEMTVLVRTHPLVKLFEHGIDLLHDNFRFSVNYYGLQQHYYNRTSMLDLTSDLEAARFFSVTDYDAKTDKYFVHKDNGEPGVLYYYDIEQPGAFIPKRNGTHLSVIGKQVFMRSGQQHGFLLNMPKDADFNTLPHVHKVFFRHDDKISQRIFNESNQGERFFPEDLLEAHWKKYYVVLKEHKNVSMDALVENHRHNKNKTIQDLRKQLEAKGYHVDKHLHPTFDADELNSYYQDIKNGLWEQFCKDIYFYSPENELYRELLLQAEFDSRYQKYFKGKV